MRNALRIIVVVVLVVVAVVINYFLRKEYYFVNKNHAFNTTTLVDVIIIITIVHYDIIFIAHSLPPHMVVAKYSQLLFYQTFIIIHLDKYSPYFNV